MSNLWYGFRCEEFTFEGRDAIVVFPDTPAKNSKIVLKTEYWGAFPDVEIQLLQNGYHLAYLKNVSRLAPKEDCDRKAAFIKFLAKKYNLSEKCIPVGMSCGGAHAIRFAGYYPELISCVYIDAPVLNYHAFPGKLGDAYFEQVWEKEFLVTYPGMTRQKLFSFNEHPMNMADTLIANKIPVLLVYGTHDATIPYEEHGKIFAEAFADTDLLTVMAVSARGHHPHGLLSYGPVNDNSPIVRYILEHSCD